MKRLLAALVGVLTVGVFAVPASAQETTRTVPSSIAADCSKEVGAALSGWISGLPNGTTGQLATNGCYLVTQKLALVGKTGVTIDGRGATIRKRPDPAGATASSTGYPCNKHTGHWQISNATNVGLRNLRLEGLGTSYGEFGDGSCHYAEHAVEVLGGAVNVRLENITASRVRGDGLYMQGVNGLVAKNYTVESNGRQGGAISRGTNVLLDDFDVLNSSRSGFDFECNRNEEVVSNIEVRGFDFSSKLIAFPAQGYPCTMTDIWIHDGRVNRALSFVYDRQVRPSGVNCGGTRKNWKVEDVTVDPSVGSYGPGSAVFCNTENVTVRNVKLPGGFVTFERSTGKLIAQNVCSKEVRVIQPSPPVQQSGNTIPPCSGTVTTPPSTAPPSTAPPSTAPPSTAPPTTKPPVADVKVSSEQLKTWRNLLVWARALTEIDAAKYAVDIVKLTDRVHDEIEALL